LVSVACSWTIPNRKATLTSPHSTGRQCSPPCPSADEASNSGNDKTIHTDKRKETEDMGEHGWGFHVCSSNETNRWGGVKKAQAAD
jgi:hypothetical protein